MASKADELRKFRHDISTLKKRGLLTGVDARSAVPNKRLNRLLDKYDPVLSGKASAVKISNKGLAEYKALGKPFEIAAPKGLPRRVIVPHETNERVTVSHGKVTIANPAGIKRTVLPVKFHNLEQYLTGLRKAHPKLEKDEYLAFRFFGNRSHRIFRSIDALISALQHYESVFDSIEENDAEAQSEIYQNLEIVKLDRPSQWHSPPTTYRPFRRNKNQTPYQTRKRKLKQGPAWKREKYKEDNARRQKAHRERLKKQPAKLEAYKAKGRKRAKKSKKKSKK